MRKINSEISYVYTDLSVIRVTKVIRCISQSLSQFHEDEVIPVYGFGDIKSKDKTIRPIQYRVSHYIQLLYYIVLDTIAIVLCSIRHYSYCIIEC